MLYTFLLSALGPSPFPQEPVQPHNPGEPGVNNSGDNLQPVVVGGRSQWIKCPTCILHVNSSRKHSARLSEKQGSTPYRGNLNNIGFSFLPLSLPLLPCCCFWQLDLPTQILLLCSALMWNPKLRQRTYLFLRIKGIKKGIGNFRGYNPQSLVGD